MGFEEKYKDAPIYDLFINKIIVAKYMDCDNMCCLKILSDKYTEDYILWTINKENNFKFKYAGFLNI